MGQLSVVLFGKQRAEALVAKLAKLQAEEEELGPDEWARVFQPHRKELAAKWHGAADEAAAIEMERREQERRERERLEKAKAERDAAEQAEAEMKRKAEEEKAKEEAAVGVAAEEEAGQEAQGSASATPAAWKRDHLQHWDSKVDATRDLPTDDLDHFDDMADGIEENPDAVFSSPEKVAHRSVIFDVVDGRETAAHTTYLEACRELMEIPVTSYVDNLQSGKAVLSHFCLGDNGMIAIARSMIVNTSIRSLDIADNRLFADGIRAVARILRKNFTLTSLNASDNNAGVAAADIFAALRTNTTLKTLQLKGNNLTDGMHAPIRRALDENSTLTQLDLSFNQLRDTAVLGVAAALAKPDASLKHLNLKWNKITAAGAAAVAAALKDNDTLILLDMSWNSLGDRGGILIGEAVATNRKLRKLDLSQNRLSHQSAIIIGDSLRFNTALVDIQLNYNPIGERGGRAIMAAIADENCSVSSWGLTATEVEYGETISLTEFNGVHPDGHYSLNLADQWEHAVAEMLRVRAVEMGARWHSPTLDGKPYVPNTSAGHAWQLPSEGTLVLDFVSGKDVNPSASKRPAVHFRLDLSRPDDHATAVALVQRAVDEPGENWLNETLNGEPFEFDEEEHSVEWIENMKSGILELEYRASSLASEAHYTLDLSVDMDHAVAYKLLERTFMYGDKEGLNDSLSNVTLDGEPINIDIWRRGKVGPDGRWIDSSKLTSLGVKDRWRIPHAGILSFDMTTARPMHVITQHYRLDLSVAADRRLAHNLRVRASLHQDENWWNEKIDGVPFQLAEDFTESHRFYLPRSGILELDFVVCRPSEVSRRMQRDHFKFDMSIPMQAVQAATLRLRVQTALFHDADDVVLGAMEYDGRPRTTEPTLRPKKETIEAAVKARHETSKYGRGKATTRRPLTRGGKQKSKSRRPISQDAAKGKKRDKVRKESGDRDGGGDGKDAADADAQLSAMRGGLGAIMGGAEKRGLKLFSEDFLSAAGGMMGVDPDAAIAKTGGVAVFSGADEDDSEEGLSDSDAASSVVSGGDAAPGARGGAGGAATAVSAHAAAAAHVAEAAHVDISEAGPNAIVAFKDAHVDVDALGRPNKSTMLSADLASIVEPGGVVNEFCNNISFENKSVPVQTFLAHDFVMPGAGVLEFDYIWFMEKTPMQPQDHAALMRELRKQSSDLDKVSLLRVVLGSGSDSEEGAFYLTCANVKVILLEILGWDAKVDALELMRDRVVDPHRMVEVAVSLHNLETASKVISLFNIADLETPRGD